MTIMQLLAIDPGPTWMGWAHLAIEHDPGVRCTYVAGGKVLSERTSFKRLLGETRASVVTIETPAGYVFNPARSPGVMATAVIAGGLTWLAEERGMRVVVATAQQVRQVLAGKANAQDEVVRGVVLANVFHAPTHHNDHVHDAIAVGLLGAWLTLGKACLPAPVAKTKKPRKNAQKKDGARA